jgi:uncharacterized protein (DUF4415 family)
VEGLGCECLEKLTCFIEIKQNQTMESFYILLNLRGSEFALSKQCEAEYTRRTGRPPRVKERLGISLEQPYGISAPRDPCNIRIDKTLLELVREKGSAWCSGPHSSLRIHSIPTLFSEYIEIESVGGAESVAIDMIEVYESFLTHFFQSIPDDDKSRRIRGFEEQFHHLRASCRSIELCPDRVEDTKPSAKESVELARPLDSQDEEWHVVSKRSTKKIVQKSEPNRIVYTDSRFNRFYLESDDE